MMNGPLAPAWRGWKTNCTGSNSAHLKCRKTPIWRPSSLAMAAKGPSGNRLPHRKANARHWAFRTCSLYWAKLPEGNLEQSTITGMKIHQRQLERHFGKRFAISALKLTDQQGYVEKRSRDKGLKGRTVTAATIRKAIVTLRTVWNWGRQHELVEKPFPSKGLRFPKGTEKPPFMTFAEVQRRAKGATACRGG
jgi:hypothetical protein